MTRISNTYYKNWRFCLKLKIRSKNTRNLHMYVKENKIYLFNVKTKCNLLKFTFFINSKEDEIESRRKNSSSMSFTLKLDQELRSCFPAWGKGSLRGTSQGASILLIFRRPSLQAVPSPSLMVPLSSWWHVFFGCTEP